MSFIEYLLYARYSLSQVTKWHNTERASLKEIIVLLVELYEKESNMSINICVLFPKLVKKGSGESMSTRSPPCGISQYLK